MKSVTELKEAPIFRYFAASVCHDFSDHRYFLILSEVFEANPFVRKQQT